MRSVQNSLHDFALLDDLLDLCDQDSADAHCQICQDRCFFQDVRVVDSLSLRIRESLR
jgi:hypothetical protein